MANSVFEIDSPLAIGLSDALSEMAARVRPAVVQVRRRSGGNGAGMIWDEGTILTNYHVVAGAGRGLSIELSDGRSLAAQVRASNRPLDLALLTVEAHGLPAAPIGDSSTLRIGELVVAIGHPWGQRDVVTAGVVSGLGELENGWGGWRAAYIRSDVRLAPGNSGGPLLNARGEVIGINAMIFGGDLSVAIPSRFAREWIASGMAGRAWLGLGVQSVELPAALRQGARADQERSLLVVAVAAGGPAARAGVLIGDLLLALDGTPLGEPEELLAALAGRRPGAPVSLSLARAGIEQQIDVILSDRA